MNRERHEHPSVKKRLARRTMDSGRIFVVLLALFVVSGCTSMQKAEYPPEALRDAIRRGEVVQPGDRVAVTSVDGGEQVFVVTEIGDDAIRGGDAAISIEEVIALEKREFSPARTGLAGLAVTTLAIMAVAASVFLGAIGVL